MSDVNDYREPEDYIPGLEAAADREVVNAICEAVFVPKTAVETRGVLVAQATQYTRARKINQDISMLDDLDRESSMRLQLWREQFLDRAMHGIARDLPAI